MKIQETEEVKYKKGELYPPDAISDLPRSCNKYFKDYELSFGREYEMGTVKCIKSFKIVTKIYTY